MRTTRLRLMFLLASGWAWLGAAAVAQAAEGHEYSLAGDLSFWSLVVFVLFVLVIKKVGWGGFVAGLDDRERRQNALIASAEQESLVAMSVLRERKGQMEAVDEEVRELIAEAGRDAQHTKDDLLGVARREAELSRQRARAEIQRVRDQSLNEIFETFADRVAAATEQRVRQSVNAAEQDRLIDSTLEQFSRLSSV